MDFSFRFDRWFERLPSSPRDEGRVHRIVVRPPGASGQRETPAEVELLPGVGLVGDRWDAAVDREGTEVSLMNMHVLRALAGAEERMALSGDNLQVDLDLSEANLPVGTVLEAGEVQLEISPEPHRPCRLFHQRFGASGAKKVARGNRTGRRGRGVLCRVLRGGTLRVGDMLRVRRPGA